MEDLIEEIVGEISNKLDDEPVTKQIKFTEGFEVSGLMDLHSFENQALTKLDVEDDVSKLSGFIISVLDEVLQGRGKIEYADWEFTVKSLERNCAGNIRTVLKHTNELDSLTKIHDEETIDVQ